MERKRLLVVGIDGASHSFVKGLIDSGELPFLGRLAQAGSLQPLASLAIPLTAIAWTTSYTGKNPGRLNIPGFVRQKKNSYLWEYVSPSDRASQDLWKIASDQGRRSILLGTIFCQNRGDFDGIFVGGEYCGDIQRCVYPEHLKTVIFDRFQYDPYTSYRTVAEMNGYIDNKFRIARYLHENHQWDLFFLGFMEPDTAHAFYHLANPAFVVESYRAIDRGLEAFVGDLGDDVDIVLYSDHGNRPYKKAFHVNSWLHCQGYLQLKSRREVRRHHVRQMLRSIAGMPTDWGLGKRAGHVALAGARVLMKLFPRLHKVLLRCRHLLPESPKSKPENNVGRDLPITMDPGVLFDYSRTSAYAFLNHGGNFAGICLNRRGRHPEGVVADEEYEAKREELIRNLRAAVDPDDGRALIKNVWRREELFHGPYVGDFPDVVFEADDDYFTYISEDNVSRNNVAFAFPSCQHERDGFLLCSGKPFRQGEGLPAQIVDMAPTLLYALDCAIPEDFDGKVIEGLFTPTHLLDHPINGAQLTTTLDPRLASGYSREEERLIEQRLRELGYFE